MVKGVRAFRERRWRFAVRRAAEVWGSVRERDWDLRVVVIFLRSWEAILGVGFEVRSSNGGRDWELSRPVGGSGAGEMVVVDGLVWPGWLW